MTVTRSLLTALALSAALPLAAQSDNNFTFYDNLPTPAATRGQIGNTTGNLLTRYNAQTFRCVGNGTGGTVTGAKWLVQDQDGSTTESLDVVIYPNGPSNGPDCANPILAGTVTTPPGSAGPVVWNFTVGFTSPVTVPCDQPWYAGLELPPGNSSDGLFGRVSPYCNQSPAVPALLYSTTPRPTCTVLGFQLATMDFGLLTEGQVLNVGAQMTAGPCAGLRRYGPCGAYLDTGRGDGMVFRLRAANSVNSTAYLLAAAGLGPPVPVFNWGAFALDPTVVLTFATATIPASGMTIVAPAGLAPGMIPVVTGSLAFQGLLISPSGNTVEFTNAERTVLQ